LSPGSGEELAAHYISMPETFRKNEIFQGQQITLPPFLFV